MNVKELVEKTREFVVKHKYYVAGGAVALLFMGGVGLALSQSKVAKNNVAVSTTTTKKVANKSESTTKSSEVVVAESKIEALLSAEPSASTDVASIEKEIANVKDEAVKAQLTQKLATVKQEVVRKQQEQSQGQQVAQAQKQDETSQKATPTQPQSAPQTQAPVQTQRQTQAPVQTTQRVTQAPVVVTTTRTPETTQATTQRYRKNSLGNSGMEFATYDEAMDWGYEKQLEVKKAYEVWTVVYSDGSKTYTVHWK